MILKPVWRDDLQSFEGPVDHRDVEFLEGAVEGLKVLSKAGVELVVVSNQPAAAKGEVPFDSLIRCHARMLELLKQADIDLLSTEYCFHHPSAVVPWLRGPCGCRKPEIGMLTRTARTFGISLSGSWMVGDSDTDCLAGGVAGCRTILIHTDASAHRRESVVTPEFDASNLSEAAEIILAHHLEHESGFEVGQDVPQTRTRETDRQSHKGISHQD